MTAITIGSLAAGEPARYAALAAALAMLVGLLCLAGRLAGSASSLTCCRDPSWSATWPALR